MPLEESRPATMGQQVEDKENPALGRGWTK